MNYSIENLKKLRLLTEVGIKECMKALDANNNDLPGALEWLRKRSLSSSKSSKSGLGEKSLSKFGLVKIVHEGNKIVAFSLKCESDFVAMNSVFTKLADEIAILLIGKFTELMNSSEEQLNEELKDLVNNASYSLGEKICVERIRFFLKEESEVFGQYTHHNAKVAAFIIVDRDQKDLARELSMQVVANSPFFLSTEDIPGQLISSRLEEIRQLVVSENSGKQSVIIEKIVNGRFNKWISEVCFLEQNDFRDSTRKIKQILNQAGATVKHLFLISTDILRYANDSNRRSK